MTRIPHQHRGPDPKHTRITLAVITGIVAGATRTLTNWLLNRLTGN